MTLLICRSKDLACNTKLLYEKMGLQAKTTDSLATSCQSMYEYAFDFEEVLENIECNPKCTI